MFYPRIKDQISLSGGQETALQNLIRRKWCGKSLLCSVVLLADFGMTQSCSFILGVFISVSLTLKLNRPKNETGNHLL